MTRRKGKKAIERGRTLRIRSGVRAGPANRVETMKIEPTPL
jgi:hypothetical protein